MGGVRERGGVWVAAGAEAHAAIRRAMGDAEAPAPARPAVHVIRQGASKELDGPAELTLEDGAVLRVRDRLPGDLPTGYPPLRRPDPDQPTRPTVPPHRPPPPDGL